MRGYRRPQPPGWRKGLPERRKRLGNLWLQLKPAGGVEEGHSRHRHQLRVGGTLE